MKKILSLGVAVCLTLSTLAAPWSIRTPKVEIVKKVNWTQPFTKSFTDPIITDFSISIVEQGVQKYLNIDYYTDFSVNYAQDLELRVYGNWYSMGGWDYKPFEVTIWSGMVHGWENFPLHPADEPFPDAYVWDYFGPR